MKRSLRITLVVILLLTAILCLAACDGLFSVRIPTETTKKGEYNITLSLNGGTGLSVNDFISGTKLVEPASEPTRSGYVFDGYYSDESFTTPTKFNVVINKDISIYAKWKASATFVFGTWKDSVTVVESDGYYTAPTDTARVGYDFGGWYSDSALKTAANFEEHATAGAIFYAKYTPISYTITYQLGGIASTDLNAKTSYTVEDEVTLYSPTAKKSGYTFVNWYAEGDASKTAVTKIDRGTTGDKSFVAEFLSHNNYILEVTGELPVAESATAASTNVSYEEGESYAILNKIRVSDRATFTVTKGDEPVTGAVELVVGDNEFTVTVTSEAGETKTYDLTVTRHAEGSKKVTFYFNGNAIVNRFVANDTTVEPIEAIEIEGYTFDAWYTTPELEVAFDFDTHIVADTTLYAKYNSNNYVITYYPGIGTNPVANPTVYSISNGYELLNATAPEGYTSLGWFDGTGTKVSVISVGTIGNKTLYARYVVSTANNAIQGSYSESGQSIAKANLLSYFNWAVAARKTQLEFTITDDDFDLNADMPDLNDLSVPTSYLSAHYSSLGKEVTATFTYAVPTTSAAAEDAYTQLSYYGHKEYVNVRNNAFDNFKINSIFSTYSVTVSDQLIYAIESGYRPEPVAGSAAETIYNAAKDVLRQIVDDSMTDMEKAHAIYDWLILNVVYDNALLTQSNNITTQKNNLIEQYNSTNNEETRTNLKNQMTELDIQLKSYKGFYLEGVFLDNRAVCDGISKAFVLMCGIEGIKCVQVTGTHSGSGHAWNKVQIDGNWYVVDATHGGTIDKSNDIEYLTHGYFMITDAERATTATAANTPAGHRDIVANTAYDVYANTFFTFDGHEYDLVVTSFDELVVVIKYVRTLIGSNDDFNQTFDFRIDYDYTTESLGTELGTALSQANADATITATYPGTQLKPCSYYGGASRGDIVVLAKFAPLV